MSTYHIGFMSEKNSAKISKPPGGGTSNIFGANDEITTPRSVTNHMKSNIFGTPPNGNAGADTRRPRSHDSHARLFGEVERQFPGSEKNYMKSSIPINNTTKSIASNENENTNEQRDNRKIEDTIKMPDHDSSAAQMKTANKNRVPPGGFSSILW